MKRILQLFLALVLLQGPAQAATLEEAISKYNGRQYGECLAKCRQLLPTGKATDKVHYYMGLSYVALTQVDAARTEYMWVYDHSKDKTLRYNAWLGLQNLQRYSIKRAYSGSTTSGSHHSARSPNYTHADAPQDLSEIRKLEAAANRQLDAQYEHLVERNGGRPVSVTRFNPYSEMLKGSHGSSGGCGHRRSR